MQVIKFFHPFIFRDFIRFFCITHPGLLLQENKSISFNMVQKEVSLMCISSVLLPSLYKILFMRSFKLIVQKSSFSSQNTFSFFICSLVTKAAFIHGQNKKIKYHLIVHTLKSTPNKSRLQVIQNMRHHKVAQVNQRV